jgi:hypothetical protein
MLYFGIAAFFFFDKVLTSTPGTRSDQRPISAKALTITHKLALSRDKDSMAFALQPLSLRA